MALPAQFIAALATPNVRVDRWLEIEGIPNAFGTVTKASGWFTSRVARERFAQVLPYLKGIPTSFQAELDVMNGLASIAGQVEFSITDVGNEQLAWAANGIGNANVPVLAADITETSTSLTYTGVAILSLYPSGGGTLYLGNETITYTAHDNGTKTFSGLVRGQYNSAAQAWTVNTIVYYRPYVLFGRRVWYYQTAQEVNGTESTDADKVLRFSGTVEAYNLDDRDAATFVLTCVSIEKELTRPVFRDLRQYRDTQNRGIVGADFDLPGARFSTDPGGSTNSARFYGPDVAQLAEGGSKHFIDTDTYLFRVDDEVVAFLSESGSNPPALRMIARGVLGTEVSEHKAGFTMKEVSWVARYYADGPPEHVYSKFIGADSCTFSNVGPDHPLIFLLCVMMSTGKGTNYPPGGAYRNYDTLPESWGLGIHYSRIDYLAIERLAQDTPDLSIGGFFESPVAVTELAKQLLAPFGYYCLCTVGDVWTIRKLQCVMPGDPTVGIGDANLINKSSLGWDANLLGLVQEAQFNYTRDIQRNRWLNNTVALNAHGKLYAQARGRVLKYDMPLVYPEGPISVPGRPAWGGMPNIEAVMSERVDFYKQGFTTPPPIITVRVDYAQLGIEPGDLVYASITNLPSVSSPTSRTYVGIARVLRKSIDDGSKTVELVLQGTWGLNYCFVAGAARVLTIVGDTVTFDLNVFTESTAPGDTTTDFLPQHEKSHAPADWVTWMLSQARVNLLSKDFSLQYAGVPISVNTGTGTVVFDAGEVPGWLTVGDYIAFNTPLDPVNTIAQAYDGYGWCVLSDADLDLANYINALNYAP